MATPVCRGLLSAGLLRGGSGVNGDGVNMQKEKDEAARRLWWWWWWWWCAQDGTTQGACGCDSKRSEAHMAPRGIEQKGIDGKGGQHVDIVGLTCRSDGWAEGSTDCDAVRQWFGWLVPCSAVRLDADQDWQVGYWPWLAAAPASRAGKLAVLDSVAHAARTEDWGKADCIMQLHTTWFDWAASSLPSVGIERSEADDSCSRAC
jgi:hypothetical protein